MSRKRPPADSLDLLLDTICNTFGGVLFIAILVIMLLNTTSEQAALAEPEEEARQELSDAQNELATTQAALDQMRAAAAEHDKLKRRFSNPEMRELVTRATREQTNLTVTSATRANNLRDAAQQQADANRIAKSLSDLDKALTKAKENLAQIDDALRKEQQLRTRTATLPRQQKSNKPTVNFLLTGGRLYAHYRLGPTGQREHETRDTHIVSRSDKGGKVSYLEPLPGGGLLVDLNDDKGAALAQKFAGWDPKAFDIAIAVWPDSFEHFAVVRKAMVNRGLKYEAILMPAGEQIKISNDPTQSVKNVQ